MKHRIYIHNIENLQKGDYFSTFQEIYQVENIEVAWVHYAPTHKRLFHILAYRVRDIIQKPFSPLVNACVYDHIVNEYGFVKDDMQDRWYIRRMWKEADLENFGTL